MPDRWGRPTISDGINLARGFMEARRFNEDMRRNREDELSRKRVKKYLNMVSQGQKPDPKTDPDFDYGDYLRASAIVASKAMADENFRATQLENDKAEIEQNQADINRRIQTAEAAAQYGDTKKAYQILAPVYNYLPDGHEFVKFKDDKTMIMRGPDGSEYTQPAPPFEESLALAKGLSDKYADLAIKSRTKFREKNLERLQNPEIWQSDDGKKKAYYVIGLDPKTGRYIQSWKDPKTGKTLKGFDEETGKIVKSKTTFYPPQYLADKRKERADKNKDIQYINWLMDAYGISKARATDIFRQDKALQQRLKGFIEDAANLPFGSNNTDEIKSLKKQWGVDNIDNAARIPNDKLKKIIEVLTEKYPPEKHSPGDKVDVDGFIFVIKNGKWQRP